MPQNAILFERKKTLQELLRKQYSPPYKDNDLTKKLLSYELKSIEKKLSPTVIPSDYPFYLYIPGFLADLEDPKTQNLLEQYKHQRKIIASYPSKILLEQLLESVFSKSNDKRSRASENGTLEEG